MEVTLRTPQRVRVQKRRGMFGILNLIEGPGSPRVSYGRLTGQKAGPRGS